MLDLLVRCLSYEWSDYWHVNIVCQVFCSSDWRVCVKCIHSKTSLGSDLVAADHATLHHMTFLALLAVCEDTILHEWIGSEMYHFIKICDAPINTKMFRYLLFIIYYWIILPPWLGRDVTVQSLFLKPHGK